MKLTPTNLKSLMNEYTLSGNPLTDEDEYLLLLDNVNNLSEPDKIILFLYAETKSYRKLAKLLKVSFSTAYKEINRIRSLIL